MTREFFIWFEPMADAAFFACATILIIGTMIGGILGAYLFSERKKTEGTKILRATAIGIIIVTILLILLNPFTEGLELWNKIHQPPLSTS